MERDVPCIMFMTLAAGGDMGAARGGDGGGGQSALRRCLHGRAVQVDPIKPVLKAPGTKLFETET